MFPQAPALRGNLLLASLSTDVWNDLGSSLELVRLKLGARLSEPDKSSPHVFFPTTSVVSVRSYNSAGDSLNVASIGKNGMTGSAQVLGGRSMPYAHIVEAEGYAYRISHNRFQMELLSPSFRALMNRYCYMLMLQGQQMAVCNRHHVLMDRACTWLLQQSELRDTDDLEITQQSVADALGVRREGMVEVNARLVSDYVINTSRGHVRLLDKQELYRRTCPCYQVLANEQRRVFPDQYREPALTE